MNIEDIDPMSQFNQEGYDEAENATGYAGAELVDAQWAVAEVVETEAERLDNEKKTLRIHATLSLGAKGYEKDALTPGRRTWHDLWLGTKKGGQQMLDAFFLHAQVGVPLKRFSEEGAHANDLRPVLAAADQDAYAQMLANALKKKLLIVHVGVESGRVEKDASGAVTRKFNDRNVIDGHYRLTDENLEAIRAAGYADGGVVKKTRTTNGKKETYLAVKPSAAEAAARGGASGTGKVAAAAEAPRVISA